MNPYSEFTDSPFAEDLGTIRRLDQRGSLYEMEISGDYYQLEDRVDKLFFGAGCSVMVTPNVRGETLFCRNYDYTHHPYNRGTSTDDVTGLDVIIRTKNPGAKYESIGVADAFWLDSRGGTFFEGVLDDGKTDISNAMLLPFLCMDGINQEGLAVGILALPPDGDWEPIEYVEYEDLSDETKKDTVLFNREAMRPWRDVGEVKNGTLAFNTVDKLGWKYVQKPAVEQVCPGRRTMTHPTLMRYFLDHCGSVDEAIDMAGNTNVKAPLPDLNFHIMLADRSGRSVILEWVDGMLRVNDADHATNFYLTKRGNREHGEDRYYVLEAALKRWPHGMPEYSAKGVLQVAAADLPLTKTGALTYWSVIYNLEKKTMKLWHMTDFDRCFEYSI